VHTTTLQLPKDLNARLEELCRRTRRTKADWIRVALDKELSSQSQSAFDSLADLAGTVKLDFAARDHKAAFRRARHAKNHR
jgi:predicted transcriptional regulator